METKWSVYFIQCGNKPQHPVKIGYTSDIETRLNSLQVACPYQLQPLFSLPVESLEMAKKLERFLHRQLYHKHHVNGEWFRIDTVNIPKLLDKFNTSHKFETDTQICTVDSYKHNTRRLQKLVDKLTKENKQLSQKIVQLEQDIEDMLDRETFIHNY